MKGAKRLRSVKGWRLPCRSAALIAGPGAAVPTTTAGTTPKKKRFAAQAHEFGQINISTTVCVGHLAAPFDGARPQTKATDGTGWAEARGSCGAAFAANAQPSTARFSIRPLGPIVICNSLRKGRALLLQWPKRSVPLLQHGTLLRGAAAPIRLPRVLDASEHHQ